MRIGELQARLAVPGRIAFSRRPDGAELIELTGDGGRAVVCTKGAHVLSFVPAGQEDLLWLSPVAKLAGPEPIRGGIPVCWPWFANHATDTTKPAHGFARTATWTVLDANVTAAGTAVATLGFETGPEHAALWPHTARLTAFVDAGRELRVTLATENTGQDTFELTEALHAYFRVGDLSRVAVEGLDGVTYLDKVDAFARKRQSGPVTFDREVDRVYVATASATSIVDSALGRRIAVAKDGSDSTVVWNPGALRGNRLAE